jgi:cyclin-dependent kinase regulatory subunit CKS1
MPYYPKSIEYGQVYKDQTYEYVNVLLPKGVFTQIKDKITKFSEEELKNIGMQKVADWENYGMFKPEPHVLLFRKKIGKKFSLN